MLTYTDLLAAEQEISDPQLRTSVNAVMASVEDNATDEEGRIESLRCLLSFSGYEPEAYEWFKAQGFKW